MARLKWVRDNIARDFTIEELAGRSRWRPGHLPGGSQRPAPSHLFSSFNGSGWRLRDTARDHAPVGRRDRAEDRICGAFHTSPADPA